MIDDLKCPNVKAIKHLVFSTTRAFIIVHSREKKNATIYIIYRINIIYMASGRKHCGRPMIFLIRNTRVCFPCYYFGQGQVFITRESDKSHYFCNALLSGRIFYTRDPSKQIKTKQRYTCDRLMEGYTIQPRGKQTISSCV